MKAAIIVKEFNLIGIGESKLAAEIENLEFDTNLKLSYQTGKAEVKLRLTVENNKLNKEQKNKILKKAARLIRKKFGNYIYGEDEQNLIDKLHSLLIEKELTISTAESFTGGLIAERLSQKPGSSNYFLGSIVAYNESIKRKLLKIDPKLLNSYGVVSKECANSMAKNAAEIFSSKISIASTGAAGPDPHAGQKAGTMFISIFYQNQLKTFKIQKNYGRRLNRYYASQFALFEVYKLFKEGEVI